MKIGIDLMGSENPVELLFSGIEQAAVDLGNQVEYIVCVTNDAVKKILEKREKEPTGLAKINFHIVSDFIRNDDEPLSAIRLKKDSSMVVGFKQLKEKKIDAFVSSGNTGALIALSSIMLPKFSGVDRPALLALIPSKKEPFALIDVGGLVSFKADQLVQFAHMGVAYQRLRLGVDSPTVGLLNIGQESKKGTLEHREAYLALEKEANINFIGNLEGRDVFQGKANVIVTDGFSGNVMLKTSEGISSFIFDLIKKYMPDEMDAGMQELQKHVSYEEYPGAIVCGVDAICVNGHGAINKNGIANSIKETHALVKSGYIKKIKQR